MVSSDALHVQIRNLDITINAYEREIESDMVKTAEAYEKWKKEMAPKPAAHEAPQPSQPSQASQTPPPTATKPAAPVMAAAEKIKDEIFGQEFRIGQKWLLIIGIVTMVFGVAFFLKYSFDQGWVGPAGRVSLAYLWGIGFLIAGHIIKNKRFPAFGLMISGGGIAVLYFATYAGFQIYHLFPQGLSFFIMVLITVLACAMAVGYETQGLAILGLMGGFLTPVLLSTRQDNYLVLFTYMTILNVGILTIAFKKRWTLLQQLGFVLTYLLYVSWYFDKYASHKFWPAILFLNIFYLIYSLIPFTYYFFKKEENDLKGFYILIPNSAIAFAFNFIMIKEKYSVEWVSVVTVLYAILFLAFAYQIYRQGEKQREALVVMLMKSSFFLIITIPMLFSRHWITVFWALQAAFLLQGAKKLGRKSFLFISYGLLFLAVIKFVAYDLSTVFSYDLELYVQSSFGYLIIERWFTMALLLSVLYWYKSITRKEIKQESPVFLGPDVLPPVVFSALFGGLLFLLLTFETSAFFHDYLEQAQFAAISIVWASFSIVLMVLGFRNNNSTIRKIALGLIFLTLFKVFLFDISNISTPYRIISFVVLGLILILISYLYNKAHEKLLRTEKEKGGPADER